MRATNRSAPNSKSARSTAAATLEEIRKIMQPLREAGGFGDDPNVLELDKSWHTLHYLLAGSAEPTNSPLSRAILGSKEIGPDLGFGPARLLDTAEVRELASALAAVSPERLAQRFDLDKMVAAKIYACRDRSELELAQEYFARLNRFFAESAARGDSILLYIR